MITKKFGVDFDSSGGALTLEPAEITADGNKESGFSSRTHPDGWTISGKIIEDVYTWVNEFEASHPGLGRVWGDFENEVYADSEEGFQDFFKKHKPHAWDYGDI